MGHLLFQLGQVDSKLMHKYPFLLFNLFFTYLHIQVTNQYSPSPSPSPPSSLPALLLNSEIHSSKTRREQEKRPLPMHGFWMKMKRKGKEELPLM